MENATSTATKAKSADNLTKKERRAKKVQQKKDAPQTPSDTKLETIPLSDAKVKITNGEIVKGSQSTLDAGASVEVSSKAEEKERRKREWEMKLAQKEGKQKEEEKESKAQLRAKRRELQEAQRLAKQQATSKKDVEEKAIKVKKEKEEVKEPKKEVSKKELKKAPSVSKVQLVHHLYVEEAKRNETNLVNLKGVHPAFTTLGAQYKFNTILGSNARCLALLSALKSLIEDLTTPPKQEFCRYLESTLQYSAAYLQTCRPFAVSMTNALRHFKLHLRQVDTNLPDTIKKTKLLDAIDTYIQDEIAKADEAISMKVTEKIENMDVILTYGCSSLIRKILLNAHQNNKTFQVIVVDGRPLLEGREMLRRLVEAGIDCKYVVISAVSNVMNRASKVLLGAHALLANGYVMSRMGTAQVALIAKAFNKPVLVCCETYKFSEKVQTDSFVYNEIGNPDKLLKIDTKGEVSPLENWKSCSNLTPLNLLYDVTPPDLVTGVVTELGFLPCSSVPVVLRIRPNELS